METVLALLGPYLEMGMLKYPWLVTVIMVMGTFRLFLKPLMTIFQNVINLTPSKRDDEFMEKMMESKAYKAFAFFVDWVASVKLPKK